MLAASEATRQTFLLTIFQSIQEYMLYFIERISDVRINEYIAYIFICIALGFFAITSSLIIVIYLSRLKRENTNKKIKALKFKFQLLIYEALVENETNSADHLNKSIIEKFKQHGLTNKISQQTLIGLIINLKKSFTGQSEQQLLKLYTDLKLYELSLKKLKSFKWNKQVEGIRELAEMSYHDAWLEISRLRHSRQPILAQEAQIASIKLAQKIPLYFLDNYLKPLSHWQQLNFYYQLLNTEKELLPNFSRWLPSNNDSLVVFSLRMIGLFKQTDGLEKVVDLLNHRSLRIKFFAVQTLVNLKAVRHVNRLFNLLDIDDTNLKACVIQAIGKLGNHYHKLTLKPFLFHESYHIRLVTAKAIKGIKVNNIPDRQQGMNRQQEVLKHVADPFL